METGLITNTAATATPPSAKKAPSNTLDKDAFLRLLVAQLRSQDPSQAQDPNQMVQQMTSFSTLEQMQNTNKLLQGIQAQNTGIFQAQATSLVGKHVQVPGNVIQESGGTGGKLDLNLDGDAASVQVVIKDASGKVVRTLDQGAQAKGSHTIQWDGLDAAGKATADGSYTVEIDAQGANGKSVGTATTTYLRVDAVSFTNGTVTLLAGGRSYALSDISQLSS